MPVAAHPLQWPQGFARTPAGKREKGAFKTTLAGELNNVQTSLAMLAKDSGQPRLADLVISSNVTLGAARPEDPGVSVWFAWEGVQVCIAVDRYSSVEANLQAIHHIVEARRTELRHGTLALVRATFAGFRALPAPAMNWRELFGYEAHERPTRAELDAEYRRKRGLWHPDKQGGSATLFDAGKKGYDAARKELGYE